MAVVPITITWPAVPGSLGYLIEYRAQPSLTWITPGPPANPANPTLSLSYVLQIDEGTTYDIRVSSQCNSGRSKYVYTTAFDPLSPTFAWVEDTYTCEQDDPFTIGDTYTGFSSPLSLYWDDIQQRFYAVDQDDINGNLWYFDPTTFTGFGDQTYVPGSIAPGAENIIQTSAHSPSLRKIYMAGPNTTGVMVYNIATGIMGTVNDGSTDGANARLFTRIMNGTLYVANRLDNTITLINPTTDTVIGTPIDVTTLPGNTGNKYFNSSYYIHPVNGELWVCAAYQRQTSGDIGRYSSDLTTFLGEITIPGAVATSGGVWLSGFWQGHFLDEAKSRFYLADAGSYTNTVIDTISNTVVDQVPVTNMEGRLYPIINWSLNDLTGQLYANKQSMDNPNGVGAINKFYIQDRDTYQYEGMYLNQLTNGLVLRPASNEFWAVTPGVTRPTAGWDTDGTIFKYTV